MIEIHMYIYLHSFFLSLKTFIGQTNQQMDGQSGSKGSYTSNKNIMRQDKIHMLHTIFIFGNIDFCVKICQFSAQFHIGPVLSKRVQSTKRFCFIFFVDFIWEVWSDRKKNQKFLHKRSARHPDHEIILFNFLFSRCFMPGLFSTSATKHFTLSLHKVFSTDIAL